MTLNQILLVFIALLFSACALLDESAPRKAATSGLIATPPSYYSTAKAKYLAAKYKENLDRIVERIVRNPKTSSLQFANNISSVGGIGFFTHSATKSPDERYLEVVLATPETFETKSDVSEKVQRLFSIYGLELLGIISGDGDIHRDKELSGYGLNLAWRNVISDPAGNRVGLARAILYFPKERVQSFLRNEINQNNLLAEAVIFSVDEDGPLNLVSYKPQELRPEFRPAIREDDLTNVPVAAKQPKPQAPVSAKEASQKIDQNLEVAKKDTPVSVPAAKPIEQESKAESQRTIASGQKSAAKAAPPVDLPDETVKQRAAAQSKDAERVASAKQNDGGSPAAPVIELKAEAKTITQKAAAKATASAPPPAVAKPMELPVEKAAPSIVAKPAPSTESNLPGEKAQETASEPVRTPTAKPVLPSQKPLEAASKSIAEPLKTAPSVAARKAEKAPTDIPATTLVAKSPEKPPIVEGEKKERETVAASTLISKSESPAIAPAPRLEATPRILPDQIGGGNADKVNETPSPDVKADELKRRVESTVLAPPPPAVPSQTSRQQEPPAKAVVEQRDTGWQAREPAAAAPAKNLQEISNSKIPEVTAKQPPVAKAPIPVPAPEQTKASSPSTVAKAEAHPVELKPAAPPIPAKRKEIVTEKSATEQLALVKKPSEAMPEKTSPAKPAAQTLAPESAKPASPPPSVPTPEARPVEVKPAAPVVTTKAKEAVAEKPLSEQVALLRKPSESAAEKKSFGRSVPKPLEGFIIQLAFNDKEKARNWAEAMQRRGYAVSVTEAGTEGALRVRLGNFTARDEAERQLRNFKQDGLKGIVINLPQAFRPEARSSVP